MTTPLPDPRVEILGAALIEETEHGLLPHRLPAWTSAQYDGPLYALNVTQGSGVRLRFATTGDRVRLHVHASAQVVLPLPPEEPLPPRGCGAFDVVVGNRIVASAQPDAQPDACTQPGLLRADAATGRIDDDPGDPLTVTFDLPPGHGAERTLEIWLPYRDRVRLLALEADGLAPAPANPAPRWIHYGSSISHGAEAASPASTWVGTAARTAGLDVLNLGLSGAAVLDPFVARTIRDEPADLISIKIGINVLNANAYGRRVFAPLLHGFLDTIRDGHPTTPIAVISPLYCPIGEDTPGPTVIDQARLPEVHFVSLGTPADIARGALTLVAMREIIAGVVAARRADGDEALSYVDGLAWYSEADDAESPMADHLHPDPPAHVLIGERAAVTLGALASGVGAGART